MRIVYFGSGTFGLPTLRRIIRDHEVALIVTQPDRPAGRKRHLTPTPVAQFALEHGISILKPEDVNTGKVVERVHSSEADAFVVISYGQKFTRPILEEHFAINLHASLLPKYRGAAPVNWAMINGEMETGVSVITVADRMDAGDVLAQRSTPIDSLETAGELHDRLAEMGPDLMLDVLKKVDRDEVELQEQDEQQVTKAPKLTKADGRVSFDQPAIRVRREIHGVSPWPGCTVKVNNKQIRLVRVEDIHGEERLGKAGVILDDYAIACSRGAIRMLEVQPPGGRVMSFDDYVHGHSVQIGSICESP